jgi:hypothetical protein
MMGEPRGLGLAATRTHAAVRARSVDHEEHRRRQKATAAGRDPDEERGARLIGGRPRSRGCGYWSGPVIHRKVSLGTQSNTGERFAERALSAAGTCRLQGRSLFTYLSELVAAHNRGDPFPALAA